MSISALPPGYDLPLSVNKSSYPSFINKHTGYSYHDLLLRNHSSAERRPPGTTQELNHAANINNTQT